MLWDAGNVTTSGCYCSHCIAKFTMYLMASLNASERMKLNISDAFNYKDVLLQQIQMKHNTKGISAPSRLDQLRSLFVTFQQKSTEQYVTDLRAHLDSNTSATVAVNDEHLRHSHNHTNIHDHKGEAKDTSINNPKVTLSCNNGNGRWTTPYHLFDYGKRHCSFLWCAVVC